MRELDPSWCDLRAGLQEATRAESALRSEWSEALEQARGEAARAAEAAEALRWARWRTSVQACEQRNQEAASRHQLVKDAWERRRTEVVEAHRAWQQREAYRHAAFQTREKAWNEADAGLTVATWVIATIACVALLSVVLGARWLALPTLATSVLVVIAAACTIPIATARRRLHVEHRGRRPALEAGPPEPSTSISAKPIDPGGEPSPPEPRSRPPHHAGPSLDLVDSWWRAVTAPPTSRRLGPDHGDEGVSLFVDALRSALPADHFVVRELLVAKSLDVDVLVVGASGVWAFEVKHWSHRIVCRHGLWRQERTYHGPGGVEATEVKHIARGFDVQWRREIQAMGKTLEQRLRRPLPGAFVGRGGLVFTHPKVRVELDRSCQAEHGTAKGWARTVAGAPDVPGFDELEQLRVIDTLTSWGRTSDGVQPRSALEEARRLRRGREKAIEAYLRVRTP